MTKRSWKHSYRIVVLAVAAILVSIGFVRTRDNAITA